LTLDTAFEVIGALSVTDDDDGGSQGSVLQLR
jgi:hypothetical protein